MQLEVILLEWSLVVGGYVKSQLKGGKVAVMPWVALEAQMGDFMMAHHAAGGDITR
jgi:hypothetical protein